MIKIRNWGTSSSISYLFRPLKIKSRQSWRVIASRHYRFIIKHLSKWIINLKVAPAPTAAVSLVKKTASCWLRGCFSVNSRDVVCFLCRYRAAGWRPRSWNLTPRSQISPLPASSESTPTETVAEHQRQLCLQHLVFTGAADDFSCSVWSTSRKKML